MIGEHCGRRLRSVRENRYLFVRRCQGCGQTFTQRKRLPQKGGTLKFRHEFKMFGETMHRIVALEDGTDRVVATGEWAMYDSPAIVKPGQPSPETVVFMFTDYYAGGLQPDKAYISWDIRDAGFRELPSQDEVDRDHGKELEPV